MIKSDKWIERMCREKKMIEPYENAQVRKGVISYGISSYGYGAIHGAAMASAMTSVNIVAPQIRFSGTREVRAAGRAGAHAASASSSAISDLRIEVRVK